MALILPDTRLEYPDLFIKGRKPTGPVQINKAHWLGGALSAFWMPTGTGPLYDYVGSMDMEPASDSGNDPYQEAVTSDISTGVVSTGVGNIAAVPGGKAYYIHTPDNDPIYSKSHFCIMAILTVNTVNVTNDDPRVLTKDNGTATVAHDWMIGWTSAGVWRTRIKGNGTTTETILISSATVTAGATVLLVGGIDHGVGRLKVVNEDRSIESASRGTGYSLTTTASKDVAIFRSAAATDNYAAASLHYAGCANTFPSDDQLLSLAEDPYQFLVPV